MLIVGINYHPELTGIGPYTTGLAEHLADRGDRVTVIAGLPHYPTWQIAPGTPRTLVRVERLAGVRVIRAAHYVPRSQDAFRRGMYEATFGATALMASLRAAHPDAILGIVPTLSSGVAARLLGRRFGAPYGLLFQDLMGPAARQSGMAGGGSVAGATIATERWSAGRARAVGIVAPAFAPYVAALGVASEQIIHVPNWTRPAPTPFPAAAVRRRFGWGDREQVVLHAGNIGLKQGLEQVVEAARVAAGRGDPVRFVLSGGGSQARQIAAAAEGLANVQILGLQPEQMHSSLLCAADVLLLSERATQVDMSLPSKLTAYYAAGRPILAAVGIGGSSAMEVASSGAGIVVPAGQPDALLGALRRLRSEPDESARLSAAGPAYAAARTSRESCLARGAALIDRIAA